jgi:hypothetical protein
MEPWVIIPVVAMVMWGVQRAVRARHGLPEPGLHHGDRRQRAVEGNDGTAVADGSVRTELDDLRRRLEELEERQDFAERLLIRERSGGLPPGGGHRAS